MWKAHIKPNAEYALREKRAIGTPFQHVRVIQHIRGNKWKVEWIDPNPGLVVFAQNGILNFEKQDHVHHTIYFAQDKTAEFIFSNGALHLVA